MADKTDFTPELTLTPNLDAAAAAAEAPKAPEPPKPSAEEVLLTEIRDLLKEGRHE